MRVTSVFRVALTSALLAVAVPLAPPAAAATRHGVSAAGAVTPSPSHGSPYSTQSTTRISVTGGGRRAPLDRSVISTGPPARVTPGQTPRVSSGTGFAAATDSAIAPPDTSLAVGNGEVVETVNSTMYVYSEGGTLLKSEDLGTFFGATGGQSETDARVVFDAQSNRWFMTGLLFARGCNGTIMLAVSTGLNPDPTLAGSWHLYPVVSRASGDLTDQPRLGISDDKVLISWDDYRGTAASNCSSTISSSLEVVDKAQVLAGAATVPSMLIDGQSLTSYFAIVGVVSQGPSSTAYALANDSPDLNGGGSTMSVFAINGTPSAANVSYQELDPSIVATHTPNAVAEPGGGTIDPDDRLLGAVLQGTDIWASSNDACPSAGTLACSRLFEIGVSGVTATTGTATVEQDFDPSITGEIYPAVTFDGHHNLHVVTTHVSTTLNPSVDEWFLGAGASSAAITNQQVVAGAGTYYTDFISPPTPDAGPYRWGDYSGAAVDPVVPGRVWLAGEYAPNAGNTTTWGTWIQSAETADVYTPVAPFRVWDTRHASAVQCGNPNGCALGSHGTAQVQIAGQGTVPASATAVVVNLTGIAPSDYTYLTVAPAGAGNPGATSDLNLDPSTIQANSVTVALSGGGAVTVYNSAGTVNVAIDVEGYFTPASATPPAPGTAGTFHSVTPLRVCDTRGGHGTACNAGSDNPLGPGQSAAVVVAGLGGGGLPGTGAAAAAVFNLTAVGPTTGTYLTAYPPNPDGSCAAPTTSNLNVAQAATLPNRVVVPIGTAGGALGKVCIFNAAGWVNFIIDVNGWFGTGGEPAVGALFHPVSPQRLCDTRAGSGTQCSGAPLGPGATLPVGVASAAAGTASTPVAVVVNATGILGTQSTYLELYPTGSAPASPTSDLNPPANEIVANLVFVGVGSGGDVTVLNAVGAINVALDLQGWFA